MTKLGLIDSPRFNAHDTGPGHPERPQRLDAVRRAYPPGLVPLPFGPATDAALRLVHDPVYLTRAARACGEGAEHLDTPDTAVCPVSFDTARLAAGGAIAAVDAVMQGQVERAFCALRPPGHHAERDRAMGFCLLNHVALAAAHLLDTHGLERVAIVDFDVHHGNGTQHTFERDPRVLFISLHQHPATLFPGTGFAHEMGVGNVLNLPMAPGSGDPAYRRAFDEAVLPRLNAFRPGFLLISAGFDADERDPLASLRLGPESFQWMTRRLVEAGGGRVVSLLEGGYDLDALREGVAAHLHAMA